MSRIGIMGGTFNPIHIGHLMLAEQALESAHLDQIWMIPTGCSYLKTKEGITVLPGTERYDMVQRAIADNDRFRCLDMEIRRPGNSYSYETMEQWKCAGRLFAACEIIAAVRGDADMKGMQEKISQLEEHFSAKIQLLSFRRIEISSSEIRARRSEGLSVRYLVPETVREYMEEKGLYLDE